MTFESARTFTVDSMSTYTIGQVADRSGFTASALRYYEGVGLVHPTARSEAGYRIYDDDAVSRLAFIARAKQLGCSLDEITDLVGIWDGDDCEPVQRRFHELVTEKIAATQRRIAELTAFGSQLQTAAAQLGAEPTDGPCDDQCACVSDGTPASIPFALVAGPTDPPIACTLDGGSIPDRVADWQAVLHTAGTRRATEGGALRIEFDEHVDLAEVTRLMVAEQECCTFFSFVVTVDARGIALEVAAPDAAAEIVGLVFGAAS